MPAALGWAARELGGSLGPFHFERRALRPRDVQIEIAYCGVCHSDLHQVKNEWGNTEYPIVPGHEIVGRVSAVGPEVGRFAAGEVAAVGCLVDSCRTCRGCKEGLEQYCEKGFVGTYNGHDRLTGELTYGGYSSHIVVDEAFVLRVRHRGELAGVAPLLCAGITTYSPLRHFGVKEGQKVGIVGLGGLGHMGVKLAHAFGARVVLFTTSPGKTEDARRLGADAVVVSRDASAMQKHAGSFDFILDTVSAQHDLDAYLQLLRRDGTLTLVGAPEKPLSVAAFSLIPGRHRLTGSLIGGLAETQEMLDYCAERGITSDVEVIPMQKIDEAYARMLKSDVRYRFVIDLSSLGGAR